MTQIITEYITVYLLEPFMKKVSQGQGPHFQIIPWETGKERECKTRTSTLISITTCLSNLKTLQVHVTVKR